jgi:ubiquinone/menaquinone biosynthesis C-methylase UbiE
MTESMTLKNRIETYWSRSADSYDRQFGHGLHSDQEKTLWLELLKNNLTCKPGAKILDVGCGTGFLSLLLAQLGYNVTGIDLSDTMRAEATRKANQMGLDITIVRGDAEAPDFSTENFSVVISRHLVWTLPNPSKALWAWKKVLKPDGQVIIIDGVWTPRDFAGRLRYFLVDLIRRIKGSGHHSSWKKEYAHNVNQLPFFGGAPPQKIISLVQNSGFTDIKQDEMQAILAHERRHGPLEYRIAYTKNRRYLISGRKKN